MTPKVKLSVVKLAENEQGAKENSTLPKKKLRNIKFNASCSTNKGLLDKIDEYSNSGRI